MPSDLRQNAGQRLFLTRDQGRTRLDQMYVERFVKGRNLPRDAKDVGHQCSTPGAEFHERDLRRSTYQAPNMDKPRADDLAEHLAHLRRGDEVAFNAERIARRVVAVLWIAEAQRHVVGDAHRAVRFDEALDPAAERRVAHAFRRRAKTIAPAPTSTIGIDRIMPMVRPPKRNPSCGSGSRTNSTRMRAMP